MARYSRSGLCVITDRDSLGQGALQDACGVVGQVPAKHLCQGEQGGTPGQLAALHQAFLVVHKQVRTARQHSRRLHVGLRQRGTLRRIHKLVQQLPETPAPSKQTSRLPAHGEEFDRCMGFNRRTSRMRETLVGNLGIQSIEPDGPHAKSSIAISTVKGPSATGHTDQKTSPRMRDGSWDCGAGDNG